MDWKTHDLSLAAFSHQRSWVPRSKKKIPEMSDFSLSSWVFKLVNTKWDIMTFSVLGRWRSPNGKLQMSFWFCNLKMSFQSTSVPLASKTNLFEKKQMRSLQVCGVVDASQVAFCFGGPFSPIPAYLCPPGPQLYPGQDKSRVLIAAVPLAWKALRCIRLSLCWQLFLRFAFISSTIRPTKSLPTCQLSEIFGFLNAGLQFYFSGNYALCGSWMILWKYKKSEQISALMQSEDVTGLDDCSSSYSILRNRADHAEYLCINWLSPVSDRMTHE